MTLERYAEMLSSQGGVCAVCKEPPGKPEKSRLAVDHCHTSGRVRGLLCVRCNIMLSFIENSPEMVQPLAVYLLRQK